MQPRAFWLTKPRTGPNALPLGKSWAQTLPIPPPPLASPVIHSSEERAGEKGAGEELKMHHELLVTTHALLLSTDRQK